MSNLIYVGDKPPINLLLVESIFLNGDKVSFWFDAENRQVWSFDDERKAKIVYEAMLRSRCKNIGECELTAEEIGEIENGL